MLCVYCLENLPLTAFKGREHVVPESMGTFENNLTLHDLVCDCCNDYFGRTIDLALGRGSAEAVHRLTYGVKPPAKALELTKWRVRFALQVEGDWNGLLLELRPEGGELRVQVVPQIGFRRSAEMPFTFISEDALLREDTVLPDGPFADSGILVVADSDAMETRLIEALRRRDIKFRAERTASIPVTPGSMVPVEVRARIDALVLRCVAKISFNYLALVEGRDFVLHKSFSPIRRFIRYGENARYPLVVVDGRPILADDFPRLRQTNGHLLTVAWAADNTSLLGQVSLFNEARYHVSLARDFSGLWRPLRSGHHFDIDSRQIRQLAASRLAIRR